MRWKGETPEMRQARMGAWKWGFALVPVQMSDGTWVWLEWYHVRPRRPFEAVPIRRPVRRVAGSTWEPDEWPRPGPPAGLSSVVPRRQDLAPGCGASPACPTGGGPVPAKK